MCAMMMKAFLAIAAAISILTLNAMSDTTRIYTGHNATGSAIYAYDTRSGRLYKGHNATGSAAYAIKGDLPKAIIVFLAEKLLD